MTALKHPVLLWGLPVAVLIIIFWLSLFCYSAIPVSGADAIRALLPGHTPTLPEALVQNLRLPRSLGRRSDRRKPRRSRARCCKP